MINKIEKERIANPSEIKLLENMECSIDNAIPLNPVMCLTCQTVFCKDCLNNWKTTSSKCPLRCDPLIIKDLSQSIFKEEFKKIKVKCSYDRYGCKMQLPISDITHHQSYCKYKIIKCNKCKEDIPLICLINHLIQNCNANKIKCIICEEEYYYGNIVSHIQNCLIINDINIGNKKELNITLCEKCSLPIKMTNNGIDYNNHVCLIKNTMNDVGICLYNNDIINQFEYNANLECENQIKRINKLFLDSNVCVKYASSNFSEMTSLIRQLMNDNALFNDKRRESIILDIINQYDKNKNKSQQHNAIKDNISKESSIDRKYNYLLKRIQLANKQLSNE